MILPCPFFIPLCVIKKFHVNLQLIKKQNYNMYDIKTSCAIAQKIVNSI